MATPEGRIKAKVRRELDKLGARCWRFMPVQTGYGAAALDFLLCVDGVFVAIETKANASKKLTDRQETTKKQLEDAGALVFVVYDDASLDTAMNVINHIEYWSWSKAA